MKRVFLIARHELSLLFYSPIAWLLIIIFLVITSSDYFVVLDRIMGYFERGGPEGLYANNLTDDILNSPYGGIVPLIIRNLYIFFPLVTMGLISREMRNGTIKLLYSSPVSITEIILGKYLAIITFAACLLVMLMLIFVSLAVSATTIDYGILVAGLIALFLVLSLYAAVGLFFSSLTSYQIVAAVITVTVLGILSLIGMFFTAVPIVRDISYYLSMEQKVLRMLYGLINLRDVSYFLLITGSFLAFTVIRIQSSKKSISPLRKFSRYAAVIITALVIGYITRSPYVNIYYDVTATKKMTITEPTKAMLAKLNEGELEITGYLNILSDDFNQVAYQADNVIADRVWEYYLRYKPDLKINYKYYYAQDSSHWSFSNHPGKTVKEIAVETAKMYKQSLDGYLSPEQISKEADVKAEEYRLFFVLKYKGKSTVVRTFQEGNIWPYEDEMAAAFSRLISDGPKIGFLSDEIERMPASKQSRDYTYVVGKVSMRRALINQGYDITTVSLKDQKTIPADIAALVIADPRIPLSPETVEAVSRYIDAGGNLFIAVEPDRKETIRPVMEKLGLTLRDEMLVSSSASNSADLIFTALTEHGKNISPKFAHLIRMQEQYFYDSVPKVTMPGACVVDYVEKDGFHISPLLKTFPAFTWNRTVPIVKDSLQTMVNKLPSDQQGSFATAIRMQRNINGKNQEIFVFGDADFISTAELLVNDPPRQNMEFGFWCFSHFSDGRFPANTTRPDSKDNSFVLTTQSIPAQKIIYQWIIPGLLAISASIILIRRKRK